MATLDDVVGEQAGRIAVGFAFGRYGLVARTAYASFVLRMKKVCTSTRLAHFGFPVSLYSKIAEGMKRARNFLKG